MVLILYEHHSNLFFHFLSFSFRNRESGKKLHLEDINVKNVMKKNSHHVTTSEGEASLYNVPRELTDPRDPAT